MEDTDIDEEVFDAAVCPECTKMTEHEILRRNVKGNGEDLLVRCVICSNVHNLQLRPPKSVFIKTMTQSSSRIWTLRVVPVTGAEVESIRLDQL